MGLTTGDTRSLDYSSYGDLQNIRFQYSGGAHGALKRKLQTASLWASSDVWKPAHGLPFAGLLLKSLSYYSEEPYYSPYTIIYPYSGKFQP